MRLLPAFLLAATVGLASLWFFTPSEANADRDPHTKAETVVLAGKRPEIIDRCVVITCGTGGDAGVSAVPAGADGGVGTLVMGARYQVTSWGGASFLERRSWLPGAAVDGGSVTATERGLRVPNDVPIEFAPGDAYQRADTVVCVGDGVETKVQFCRLMDQRAR